MVEEYNTITIVILLSVVPLSNLEATCTPVYMPPSVLRLNRSAGNKLLANWDIFLDSPGLQAIQHYNATSADYEFQNQKNNLSLHFPHAMEQLYRCWSWFAAHPYKEPFLDALHQSS